MYDSDEQTEQQPNPGDVNAKSHYPTDPDYYRVPQQPQPGEAWQAQPAGSEQYGQPAQGPVEADQQWSGGGHPYTGNQYTSPAQPNGNTQPYAGQYASSTSPVYTGGPAPRRRGRGGVVVLLLILAALLFSGGLFAGHQWGASDSTGSGTFSVGSLQTGNNTTSTNIPPASNGDISSIREAVVAKVTPAVVQIDTTTAKGQAIGSGVIIDQRGYIITNNHVIDGAQTITVTLSSGTKLPGKLTGQDPADDLAVVQVNAPSGGLTVASLGDSSKLRVGQDVLAIGNPLGITQTVTNGIVSALGRNVSEGTAAATLPNVIQTDAPINPGNSGGALVDLQGHLIGIPTLTAIDPEFNTPANGVGFAISSNRVSFIAPQLIDNGKVTHSGRAGLGVSVATVDQTTQAQQNLSVDHGALIVKVNDNSAAAQAGLKVGDVIVKVGNTDVTDLPSLGEILATKNPGDVVPIGIYRGSQQMTISVKLGELQIQ